MSNISEQNQIEIISNLFDEENITTIALNHLGYSSEQLPPFNSFSNPILFWQTVIPNIQGGIDNILRIAARIFPHNKEILNVIENKPLSQFSYPDYPEKNYKERTCFSLVITGYTGNIQQLSEQINNLSQQATISTPCDILYQHKNVLAFHFNNVDTYGPKVLINFINNILYEIQNKGININLAPFRDYILSRIFVEGPDQQRFELSNIPASTYVSAIVRATISQYSFDMWPQDANGVPHIKQPQIIYVLMALNSV